MREIIRLLTDNPILLILLVMWLLSAVGGVFTRAARKAEQERRRAAQEQRRREQASPAPSRTQPAPRARPAPPEQEQRPTVQQWPEQEPRWPPQRKERKVPPAPRRASAGRPRTMTPEEAATEIRRLMGMEEEEPAARRPPPRPEPRAEPVADSAQGRRSLSDFRSIGTRHLEIHVDPHVRSRVGETAHDRHLVRRRSGLAPERRPSPTLEAPSRRPYELSELRNLPKAFVLREILGPPKALQDQWPW